MSYYAGFDTDIFPGHAQLEWLKRNTNLVWCGYYLAPAPSHGNTSWMGNRAMLIEEGWGLLPIYVGQQTTGAGSHDVSASQGAIDGSEAARLMNREGFSPNSYVFIDWEDGNALGTDAQVYLRAWAAAVMKRGYHPGIYCSHDLAATMASLMATLSPAPALRIWAWNIPTDAAHPYVGALDDFPDGAPSGSGYPDAVAWQCQQNCALLLRGAPIANFQVDLSTSSLADPSEPCQSS
ncbi:hypothetical protein WT01_24485 [Burkholderia cepacia]|uniref:glycoside hydrolase domain-containing protein n=1 Tax=Burkholderia cepacia TaxID=292 RepID=UPI000756C2A6|nr:glycoside hydrolase domain-containing protein [Burkholderia cepacia]KVH37502.1 hypothetical protein WS88_14255 [Burkholderia cepacia]KVK98714.1 hypothetical protein WS93_18335 [Burkholderia cepacia]KVL55592.1 hypothetical protein WT01_24485 [Burkholderia cepacia]